MLILRWLALSLENLAWRTTGFLSLVEPAAVAAAIATTKQSSSSSRLWDLWSPPLPPPLGIWLAVPKSKISHQKKRVKGTLRDRLRLREDIITDPRTGETTLRHRLPWNWKDYLMPETVTPK
jgi:ribosomal protein L32